MKTTLRRFYVLLLPLLLGLGRAAAQPAPLKFGKPDPKDFEAATFAHDSAAAVILCDYGTSVLHVAGQGLQLEYERTCRIKILRKAGFEWATVEIPLFGSRQSIASLRGFTYNLVNGVVVKDKLEGEATYTDDVTHHFKLRRFTLPNVREGSVIEFTYSTVNLGSADVRPWQFQYPIPVRWSEYRASYLDFFDYRTVLQGYLPLAVREFTAGNTLYSGQSVKTGNFRWVMKDVPAFATEPYLSTPQDYVARLDLELTSVVLPNYRNADLASSWESVDAILLAHPDFGQALEGNGFLKAAVAAVPPPPAPPAERVAAVHALVREAVKYTGYNSALASAPLRKTFLETHRGGSADITQLLIAALRAAGLEANPVLLSTRDHGRLLVEYPRASKYNYVVAHVALPDGHELLVDATEPLLPAGMLPERCLNQVGRLVLKTGGPSRWLDLKPSQRRTHFQQVKMSLAADGSLRGTVHEEYAGYAAATQRAALQELGEARYRSQFASQHGAWTVPAFAIGSRAELARPLALDYAFAQPADGAGEVGQAGETPAGPAALAGPVGTFYLALFDEFAARSNPFRREGRTYPVDFATAQDETLTLTLTLPPGYEVSELPKPAIVDLPDDGGRYQLRVAAAGAEVQLVSRLSLRKAVYAAEEYAPLRELYRLMLVKQAEKLVIKKKA